MSSKPLGIMGVSRIVGWTRHQIYEALVFREDKIIVVRTATGFRMDWGAIDSIVGFYKSAKKEQCLEDLSVEELLSADINNFVIKYDQIRKVELKTFGKGAFLNIHCQEKKYHWNLFRLSGSSKVEDFESFLQPLFKGKFLKSKFL
jgi:hypothetical protein